MGGLHTIVRHLLATIDPRAAVLDRDGGIVVAPHGAPEPDATFHDAVARLDAGHDIVVLDGGEGMHGWRLQPVREGEHVTAVVAIPHAHRPSRAASTQADDITSPEETRVISIVADELATLSETATILVAVIDTDYRYCFASRAYAEWFELDGQGSVVGQHARELLGEALFERVLPMIDKALAGELVSFETEVVFRGVGRKHVRVRYIPARNAAGRVTGLYVLIFDLTPHASLQRALTRSEQRLEAFFDDAPVGMCILDDELRYIKINTALAAINGFPVEAHLGRRFRDLIPQAAAIADPIVERVLATGEPHLERSMAMPDGDRERSFMGSIFRLPGVEPGRWQIGALILEVTEQRRVERALAETEARFQEIVEHLEEVVWTVSGDYPDLEQVYISPAYSRIFGRTVEDAFQAPNAWMEAVVPEDRARAFEGMRAPRNEIEYRIRRSDGAIRWISAKSYPVHDPDGRVLRRVGTATDITERMLAEQALRASEERFRVALENTPILVFNQDLELRYTWMSRTEPGFSLDGVLGKRDGDLLDHREDAEPIEQFKRMVIDTEVGARAEFTMRIGGAELTYDLAIEPLRGVSGEVIGITGVSANVSPMREAAEAHRVELERMVEERTEELVCSEARLRAVLETASEVIIAIDRHGIIESCNRAIFGLLGYAPEDLLGCNVSVLMPEPDHSQHDGYLERYHRTGESHILGRGREVVALSKQGERIPVRLELAETDVDGERMYVGVLQDRRPEELAREALRYRATLVDSMKDAVISTDLQMKVVTWSGAAEAIYGWRAEEAQGIGVTELLATELDTDIEEARDQLVREGSWRGEAKQRRKDGSWVTVSSHVTLVRGEEGEPVGVLAVNADVTAIKELQAQYAHAQKMEAVGRLTAGIAHDFGNLLMGISGCAALALAAVDIGGPAARNLRALIEAVKRGTGLSRRLMSFTRKQGERTVEVLNLDAVVVTTRSLLERLIGDDIELATDLACPSRRLQVDASQLEQILVNLIINARDAMPGGGRITVQTEELDVSEHDAERRGLHEGGRYVRLTVTDTGHGMDEATRARLFEPFFTTKPVGEGTGLGLSTVYAHVKEMGGGIEVRSNMGEGASFLLYFPCCKADAAESTVPEPLAGGTETVLVVEDEDLVRLTVCHYLESLGYSVLEASGPTDALRTCTEHAEPIDLLLSDVVMPEIGGRECARRAREILPGLRVLFMSAHPQESLLTRGSLQPGDDVLHKPFSRTELALAVRKMLDTKATLAPPRARAARRGRILVVDDAELTLLSIGDFLEVSGYRTAVATTAREALSTLARSADPIHVVLTDYSLPDMKGTALAEEIRRRHPEVAIVYMSGFSRDHAGVGADVIWLQKPFDLEDVAAAIDAAWPAS